PQLFGNYVMPANLSNRTAAGAAAGQAVVSDFLGRAPSGGVANVTMNIVTPGTLYGDRINQLDLRFSKILRYGRTRTKVSLDMYNALNSHVGITYNNTFNFLPAAVPSGEW